MSLKLFNTLTRNKEILRPLHEKEVGFYACGPTVYQRAHLGNLRTYINQDLLKRAILMNGLKVKHVLNITDVGHLESDADTGEDKIEKAARSKHKSAKEIAREYEKIFKDDLKKLNILPPEVFPRASAHIKEQIALVKKLESRGLTYKTSDGIYFDTSRFKKYGVLVSKKISGLRSGARVDKREKRSPTDFALWKFSPPGSRRQMEWPSPWGTGFPGWHLECSAMSVKYLGMPFDIHAGGIDHIHPHHTNEIAQSEAAFGKKFVNLWSHSEFLIRGDARMGKSEGNAITLSDLSERGFDPLDFRYLALTAHYRSPLLFSWEALLAAKNARKKLNERVLEAKEKRASMMGFGRAKKRLDSFHKVFMSRVNNDLDVPGALGLLWKFTTGSPDFKKNRAIYDAFIFTDHLLGLNLARIKHPKVPKRLTNLLWERERERDKKNWARADEIRREIEKDGFTIEDTSEGARLKKNL